MNTKLPLFPLSSADKIIFDIQQHKCITENRGQNDWKIRMQNKKRWDFADSRDIGNGVN